MLWGQFAVYTLLINQKLTHGSSVIAQVSGTIGRPKPDRPYEGLLTINSEISPMASSVYESGR